MQQSVQKKKDRKKAAFYGSLIGDFLYRYRFALAFLLLIVLTAFKISGSSMGCWSSILGEGESGVLMGTPRALRSDEWGTLTPLCFRQEYNTLGAYSRYSLTLNSIRTDNLLVYGQPCWDILTLFRPFYWGYLLFGSERGLSWFWCARLIALFLSWFELGMLISENKRTLAVMLAVCVTFAPFLQWWFAVNGLVEMLIYGAGFVLGSYYLVSRPFGMRKFAAASGMALCAVGYVLTFYPTWMAPVAWGFVPLFLWVIVWKSDKKALCRKDILPWFAVLAITATGLITLAVTSMDVIRAELDSVYPGKAVQSGGGNGIWWMMKYPLSLLCWMNQDAYIVENSSIICFAPAGFLLSLWVIFKEKKKDPLLILLMAVNVFFVWFYCIGIPVWLSKLLLLSFTNANRGPQVLGFLRLTLLIRALCLKEKSPQKKGAFLAAGISSAIAVTMAWGFTKYDTSGLRWEYFASVWQVAAVWTVFAGVFYMLYRARKKNYTAAAVSTCMVVFLSSLWINPIAQGTLFIRQSETLQAIRNIVEENPQAVWLAVDTDYPATNIPAMEGADCFNTTQTYPQKKRWELLDEDGESEEIYNRYCHIAATIGDETALELLQRDYVRVTLTTDDLKRLRIRYIFSGKAFEERFASNLRESGIDLRKCCDGANFTIYECVY